MHYEIVEADEQNMAEVEAWLDEEEAVYTAGCSSWELNGYEGHIPARGFRCNWDTVKRSWKDGETAVHVLMVDCKAVGFLSGMDILEIKPNLRQNGYGRILANFMLKSAYDEGRSLVKIEIAPASAEPFWKSMGFTCMPNRRSYGGGAYAFKILHRTFCLTGGERIPFSVAFYVEEEGYKSDPKPFSQFSGLGERLPDGSIQLPERAYCFQSNVTQHSDYFVKIIVNADGLHFFDKAKREESKMYGIKQDEGYTYFIDRIFSNS